MTMRGELAHLADEWDRRDEANRNPYLVGFADGRSHAATELRALLDTPNPRRAVVHTYTIQTRVADEPNEEEITAAYYDREGDLLTFKDDNDGQVASFNTGYVVSVKRVAPPATIGNVVLKVSPELDAEKFRRIVSELSGDRKPAPSCEHDWNRSLVSNVCNKCGAFG